MKDESIFLVLFFTTALVSILMSEEMSPTMDLATPDSYTRCHDPVIESELRTIADETPGDASALKSLALRAGLCQLVEQGDISPQQASAAWQAAAELHVNQSSRRTRQGPDDVASTIGEERDFVDSQSCYPADDTLQILPTLRQGSATHHEQMEIAYHP